MTIQKALKEGYSILFYAEVDTPYLDAALLLAYALNITKEHLFASLPDEIKYDYYRKYKELLDSRCKGIPVSYIRNLKEFYGLEFYVDQRVLVPRPETEILIQRVIEILQDNPLINRLHDLCTGCGCIAITIKHLYPNLCISASDISLQAGEVFRKNSQRILGQMVPFFTSDLFSNVNENYDIITTNPPYLTSKQVQELKAIGWPEPRLALDGGNIGMFLIEKIIRRAYNHLNADAYLVMEADPGQMVFCEELMIKTGYNDIKINNDLSGKQRIISAKKC